MGWNPFRRAPLLNIADDRGTGPVVVLIHGIASSAITFRNVVPLLEHDFRCISILAAVWAVWSIFKRPPCSMRPRG